jgi:REP element-mobilizing transposase RayT
VHFPKSIRLPDEAYTDPDARFHLTIAAHPTISQFSPAVREAVWASVIEQVSAGRVQLFAACLMPDHLHLLVGPAGKSVIKFVQQWKSWTTRLAWSAGHKGELWQPGVWDRKLRQDDDFETVCRYILQNPVKAGLASEFDEWRWNWAYWMEDAAN